MEIVSSQDCTGNGLVAQEALKLSNLADDKLTQELENHELGV